MGPPVTAPAPPPTLHTVQAIAEHFHVHPQTVRKWIRDGELGHVPVGKYKHVTDDQLAQFIAAHRRDV